MSLLEVEGLGVRFHLEEGDVDAVHSASLTIEKGETVALVGESGSGKSVTALSVLQLLPYPRASHPHGNVRFEGEELLGAPAEKMRALRGNRVAMIFQEPMTSLNPLHSIEKQISETLILHRGMKREEARLRALELLRLVGLPHVEERLDAWPHQLSGGQRQRVMIAMALANEPDLLIADEPTTALDVTIQAQILQLLKDLQRQFGMAILLITHDLGIVRHMAERVYVMSQGEVVETAATEALFKTPQHDYTKKLLAAEPSGQAPVVDEAAPIVVETENLRVWFPIKRGLLRRTVGHVKAVDGISLCVRAGQTVGVVGESGSGKTTLGQALLRLVGSEGPILFEGARYSGLAAKRGAAAPASDANRLPRSILVVEPAHVGVPSDRRGIISAQNRRSLRRAPRTRSGCIARGGFGSGEHGSLSTRVFRRPAPAHCHCPRHGIGAAFCRARRTDKRARQNGAGTNNRALARPAGQTRFGLSLYQPRSKSRARDGQRDDCYERWPRRRARPFATDLRCTTARLYARAARCRARGSRRGLGELSRCPRGQR